MKVLVKIYFSKGIFMMEVEGGGNMNMIRSKYELLEGKKYQYYV